MGVYVIFSQEADAILSIEQCELMKSLCKAPASTLRYWGLKSAEAFDYVSSELNAEGFIGPKNWSDGALVAYPKVLFAGGSASVSISAFTADNEYAAFDCSVVLRSLTLRQAIETQSIAGFEHASRNSPGWEPFLTVSLSHLKWCEAATSVNPSWTMSLFVDTKRPNAHVFIEDFRRLMIPFLAVLNSDQDFENIMTKALQWQKPEWVLSDGPRFARLPTLLQAMRDREPDSV